jgi:hypothetical protein
MSDAEISGELAVIETRMRSDRAGYVRDEAQQARYRDLLDARSAGGATVPAQRGGNAASRRAEIEAIMKSDRASYFKNEALQREYYDLIAADLPAEPTEETRPAPAAKQAAQPEAQQAPAAQGLEPAEQERASQRVGAVLSNIDPAVARDLEASFAGLTPAAQGVIARELARPESGFIKPADPGEIAAFKRLPGGRELAAHWGSSAPRKVAVALEAYNRIRGALSEADRPQFLRAFHGATAREFQLFLWQLGS